MTKLKPQAIKTKADHERGKLERGNLVISGWFDGRRSIIYFQTGDSFLGTLSGGKLYRLAKAIVRHWEADRK